MRSEGRHRAAVIDRCWSIYLCLSHAFSLPENFHVEFPVATESALTTGVLHVSVPMSETLTLSLREEYALGRQGLEISRYSYNLLDSAGNNLLRADDSPFHRTDYRRRALTHPPHHMHDGRGRVLSFSGLVQDFITHAKSLLEN
jgi:hypothetical protein